MSTARRLKISSSTTVINIAWKTHRLFIVIRDEAILKTSSERMLVNWSNVQKPAPYKFALNCII
jgi:hypothetical protein